MQQPYVAQAQGQGQPYGGPASYAGQQTAYPGAPTAFAPGAASPLQQSHQQPSVAAYNPSAYGPMPGSQSQYQKLQHQQYQEHQQHQPYQQHQLYQQQPYQEQQPQQQQAPPPVPPRIPTASPQASAQSVPQQIQPPDQPAPPGQQPQTSQAPVASSLPPEYQQQVRHNQQGWPQHPPYSNQAPSHHYDPNAQSHQNHVQQGGTVHYDNSAPPPSSQTPGGFYFPPSKPPAVPPKAPVNYGAQGSADAPGRVGASQSPAASVDAFSPNEQQPAYVPPSLSGQGIASYMPSNTNPLPGVYVPPPPDSVPAWSQAQHQPMQGSKFKYTRPIVYLNHSTQGQVHGHPTQQPGQGAPGQYQQQSQQSQQAQQPQQVQQPSHYDQPVQHPAPPQQSFTQSAQVQPEQFATHQSRLPQAHQPLQFPQQSDMAAQQAGHCDNWSQGYHRQSTYGAQQTQHPQEQEEWGTQPQNNVSSNLSQGQQQPSSMAHTNQEHSSDQQQSVQVPPSNLHSPRSETRHSYNALPGHMQGYSQPQSFEENPVSPIQHRPSVSPKQSSGASPVHRKQSPASRNGGNIPPSISAVQDLNPSSLARSNTLTSASALGFGGPSDWEHFGTSTEEVDDTDKYGSQNKNDGAPSSPQQLDSTELVSKSSPDSSKIRTESVAISEPSEWPTPPAQASLQMHGTVSQSGQGWNRNPRWDTFAPTPPLGCASVHNLTDSIVSEDGVSDKRSQTPQRIQDVTTQDVAQSSQRGNTSSSFVVDESTIAQRAQTSTEPPEHSLQSVRHWTPPPTSNTTIIDDGVVSTQIPAQQSQSRPISPSSISNVVFTVDDGVVPQRSNSPAAQKEQQLSRPTSTVSAQNAPTDASESHVSGGMQADNGGHVAPRVLRSTRPTSQVAIEGTQPVHGLPEIPTKTSKIQSPPGEARVQGASEPERTIRDNPALASVAGPVQSMAAQPQRTVQARDLIPDLDPWYISSLERYISMLRQESQAFTLEGKISVFSEFVKAESGMRGIEYPSRPPPPPPTTEHSIQTDPALSEPVKQDTSPGCLGKARSMKPLSQRQSLEISTATSTSTPTNEGQYSPGGRPIVIRGQSYSPGGRPMMPRTQSNTQNISGATQEHNQTSHVSSPVISRTSSWKQYNHQETASPSLPVLARSTEEIHALQDPNPTGPGYDRTNSSSGYKPYRNATGSTSIAPAKFSGLGAAADGQSPQPTVLTPTSSTDDDSATRELAPETEKTVYKPYVPPQQESSISDAGTTSLAQASPRSSISFPGGKSKRHRPHAEIFLGDEPNRTEESKANPVASIDGLAGPKLEDPLSPPPLQISKASNPPALAEDNKLSTHTAAFEHLHELSSILSEHITDAAQFPLSGHPLLAHLADILRAHPQNFDFMSSLAAAHDSKASLRRRQLQAERERRQSENEVRTDELYNNQEIGYGDISTLENEFREKERKLKVLEDRDEYELYVKDVFSPIYHRLQSEIGALMEGVVGAERAVIGAAVGLSGLRVKPQVQSSSSTTADLSPYPLVPALGALADLHAAVEERHARVAAAITERDRRYKRTEIGPLYEAGDIAQMRNVEKHFEVAERSTALKAAQDRDGRVRRLVNVVDEAVVRGVKAGEEATDEVLEILRKIQADVHKDGHGWASMNEDERAKKDAVLSQARLVLSGLAATNQELMCAFHKVETTLNDADYEIGVTKARLDGADAAVFDKLMAKKAAEDKKLAEDLSKRINIVEEEKVEFEELLGQLMDSSNSGGVKQESKYSGGRDQEDMNGLLKKALEEAKRRNGDA
ncbi:hypothetical protein BDY21DRAFT_345683 [Lineolata rhizophorae]|uniref:Uncharacterized protein n=1 Tax=Lineolata rhizophorae TaxID=578093 RepID=A0A6A6NYQ1_9PEZI|nr:hypothetical protein BDY21DRAFT_345683 [Lineolata rhizophorae]